MKVKPLTDLERFEVMQAMFPDELTDEQLLERFNTDEVVGSYYIGA